ncbi:hypothetical protein [Pseudonocardia sp. DLS-67]
MKNLSAFEFDDLAVLLRLDPTDPADQADIEALDEILTRRRTMNSTSDRTSRNPVALRLVPDPSP